MLFNHFVELVIPYAYFAPYELSAAAGIITILFHMWLFASGNFSFLGLLTMVIALSTISDSWWKRIIKIRPPELSKPGRLYFTTTVVLTVLVAVLSLYTVRNMVSRNQLMNSSFEPLRLVNTYGAFGTITRSRYEVIIEGTDDSVITGATRWREYEFIGKPGDVNHVPPKIAPYHLRLDWLMWFAALSTPAQHPWFINLMGKILEGDKAVLGLLRYNPFPDKPPEYVRALIYEYHFTTPEEKRRTGAIWKRKYAGVYFPTVSLDAFEEQR